MKMKIVLDAPRAEVHWGHLTAVIETPVIRFAHMGCKLLGKSRSYHKERGWPFPDDLEKEWESFPNSKYVLNTEQQTKKLGETLAKTLAQADAVGIKGMTFWDTMRGGSDYWRPGNGLTGAADRARQLRPGTFFSYERLDELCPSRELLKQFDGDDSTMTFGEYAQRYAHELAQERQLDLAAAGVVMALAKEHLAVFYCTDPYVPNYCSSAEMLSGHSYTERQWLARLPHAGCHRIVLAEELAKVFRSKGFAVELFEVDQLYTDGTHRRLFAV